MHLQVVCVPEWLLQLAMIMMTSWHGKAFRITGHLWGEPLVSGGSPHKGPVMRSFDVFFVVIFNKLLNSQVVIDLRYYDTHMEDFPHK